VNLASYAAVLLVFWVFRLPAVPAYARQLPSSQGARQGAATPSDDDPAAAEIRRLLKEAHYPEAEKQARALLAAREAHGARAVEVARAVDLLVQASVEGGKAGAPGVLEDASRAVDLKQNALGPDDLEVAVSLANLGLVLRRVGKLDEAQHTYDRALRIRETALGPAHPDVARTLAALAALANNRGDFAKARELGERALDIAEGAQPADPVLVAVAANNLAIALYELSDYSSSQQRLELALRAYERALGPDHPEVAKTSSNLANVVGEAGDLAGARVLYERALAIQRRRQGPGHPDVAVGLNNLADIYFRMGDYAQARALFEQSLGILERAFGAEHTRVAMALGNLAAARVSQGDFAAAEPLYERALRIREKAVGPDHPSLVYTLTGLGELRMRVGDQARARALYERALTIGERAFGPEHSMVAVALQGMGELLLAQGELAAAEQRIARALSIRRGLLGEDHPVVAESRALLAVILARTGRTGEAFDAALEAERVAREHLQVTAQALSERQAMVYAARRTSGAAVALSLLTDRPGPDRAIVPRVWDAVVRSRAAILEELASRQRLIAHAPDPQVAKLAGDLVAARERLAALLARSAADPASRTRVEHAARQRDQAERALAERSLAFRTEQQRTRAGLADALAALPPASALVAFARFSRHDFGGPAKDAGGAARGAGASPADANAAYVAFVARSDGSPPVSIPLAAAAAIESAVTRWRSGIASEIEAGHPTRRAERLHRETGVALRRLVWDPLTPSLQGITRVFLVGDGALHLVNVGAFPRDRGGYLVEDLPLVHYLSSERDLASVPTEFGTGLLIVDDPQYDRRRSGSPRARVPMSAAAAQPHARGTTPGLQAVPPCRDLQSLEFEPLPETRREADAIAALWAAAARPRPGAPDDRASVVRLSGTQATEAAVKGSATGVRVLHLATHGFFLGAWCDDDAPDRATAGAPGKTTSSGSPPARAPLLLAGLALAGANQRRESAPGEEEGILMAEEIATLDLRGVEWAVLSACDTGVGLSHAGEGLFGLRRVFQIAGAHTVIATLWPVDDRTTRTWMTVAYRERFIEGRPTGESVRAATLKLLEARRARGESTHPAYWGPFIAVGR
jgi:CHAT domain-containing protein/tetratricopeptide (TPR) repeat protein